MGALDRMWENRPGNNGNYNDPDYRSSDDEESQPLETTSSDTSGQTSDANKKD